jgi:murein peptide amidase A
VTGIFGETESGLAMTSHRFGRGDFHLLILGGVHGDEVEGVVLANAILGRLLTNDDLRLRLTLVPTFNLDGVLAKTRGNARHVDLNRNLPTKDWSSVATTPRYQPGPKPSSESENKALVRFIEVEKPQFIISLHSWKPMLNINEPSGSNLCARVASTIASHTGDIIEPTIGYSTPGCLGTYAGLERGIPTITYEIERGLDAGRVINKHLAPIFEGIKILEW